MDRAGIQGNNNNSLKEELILNGGRYDFAGTQL